MNAREAMKSVGLTDADCDCVEQALAAAGYAVVPVEPTEAMFEAADDALDSVYNGVKAEPENLAFEAVYKAMIAAAKGEA